MCESALSLYVYESESCSVVSNSLRSHGLYSPWNSPGQNTGLGSLSLFQGIFPTQVLNPGLSHIAGRFFTSWATIYIYTYIYIYIYTHTHTHTHTYTCTHACVSVRTCMHMLFWIYVCRLLSMSGAYMCSVHFEIVYCFFFVEHHVCGAQTRSVSYGVA